MISSAVLATVKFSYFAVVPGSVSKSTQSCLADVELLVVLMKSKFDNEFCISQLVVYWRLE